MNVWKIDFSYGGEIPDYMREGLRQWVMFGRTPGHFLTAVLKNDLREACVRADDTNVALLLTYVRFLYNEVPGTCWGSKDHVTSWLRNVDIEIVREENFVKQLKRHGFGDMLGNLASQAEMLDVDDDEAREKLEEAEAWLKKISEL